MGFKVARSWSLAVLHNFGLKSFIVKLEDNFYATNIS